MEIEIDMIKEIIKEFEFNSTLSEEEEIVLLKSFPDTNEGRLQLKFFTSMSDTNDDKGKPLLPRGNTMRLSIYDTLKSRTIGRSKRMLFVPEWKEVLLESIDHYVELIEEDMLKRCPRCNEWLRFMYRQQYWGCNGYNSKRKDKSCTFKEYIDKKINHDNEKRTNRT